MGNVLFSEVISAVVIHNVRCVFVQINQVRVDAHLNTLQ